MEKSRSLRNCNNFSLSRVETENFIKVVAVVVAAVLLLLLSSKQAAKLDTPAQAAIKQKARSCSNGSNMHVNNMRCNDASSNNNTATTTQQHQRQRQQHAACLGSSTLACSLMLSIVQFPGNTPQQHTQLQQQHTHPYTYTYV